MADSLQTNSHQAGVTLTELLVVVLVIATIAGFALMRSGAANEVLTRQNVAQQLKSALERARFDSVKRRADNIDNDYRAKVTVTPTSYTLRTFNNDVNSMPIASDAVTTLPAGIVIGLYDGTTLTSQEVAFDMRGETPASPPPQFYVCNLNCTSPTNTTANILIVTPTGTVNLLPGGSTLPTFGVPAVDPVPVGSAVNPDAVLN
jgi:prepilin-type N-terminal cleavage/methylation domain-containing protein